MTYLVDLVRQMGRTLAAIMLSGLAWQAADAAEPIRLGILAPIQDDAGKSIVDGATMAVEEINARGGVLGRPLEIVLADETLNPEQAVTAASTLLDQEVTALIGGYGWVAAQIPHVAEEKTVYLVTGTTAPEVTDFVSRDYEQYKYIFRVYPTSSKHVGEDILEFLRDYLLKKLDAKRIGVALENHDWARAQYDTVRAGLKSSGVEIPVEELLDIQTTDFSPALEKFRGSNLPFVLIFLALSPSDVFVKQWYDARMPFLIGGIDVRGQSSDYFERLGGKPISEIVGTSALRAPITDKTIPFWDSYVQRFGRAPLYTGIGTYDAVYVYADAVERAGTTDPDAVVKALEKTDYPGVVGRVAFDEAHDRKPGPGFARAIFVQWQAGGQRVILWPPELRTGELILPPWMQ